MKLIKLTGKNGLGYYVMVDEEDYESLSFFNWNLHKHKTKDLLYARCTFEGETLIMHRFIMNVEDTDDFVDHIDGNGLNNQKSNLRVVDIKINSFNRVKQKRSRSKYKGVDFHEGKWRVRCTDVNGKRKTLRFLTEDEAGLAYNKMASEFQGVYAKLNIIN